MMKKVLEKQNGITLVALVVTIVVLLILAGVSLNLVLSNSGIISQAENSKNRSEYATINDCLQLKVSDYILDKVTGSTNKNLIEYLQDEGIVSGEYNDINVLALVGKELSTGKGDDKSGYYWLEEDGESENSGTTYKILYENADTFLEIGSINDTEKAPVNWDKIVANLQDEQKREVYLAQAGNMGQNISSNKDIGIGTDGKVVNLSLWQYTRMSDGNGIRLGHGEPSNNQYSGYSNSNITDDGKIQGAVPQYIYLYSKNTVYPVTSMKGTFCGCTSLKQAPKLPETITSMASTFYSCTSLTEVPEIPNSVTDMEWTFGDCTSLTQAPVIPTSVTNMNRTFAGCTNLTGTIKINASLGITSDCFNGTVKPIVITGSCDKLEDLAGTANNNNVTIQ